MRRLVLLALAASILFVMSSLPLASATQYAPGVKAGDYAVWKLDKFYDASTLRLDVSSVNGPIVTGNITLQREDGSVYSSAVSISVLYGGGATQAYDTVLVFVKSANATAASVLIQSTGVFDVTKTENLSLSYLEAGPSSFDVASDSGYDLAGTASVPLDGQLSLVITLSRLTTAGQSTSSCLGNPSLNGCAVPLGVASQSVTVPLSVGQSRSAVFQSAINSSLSYSFAGLDLPPLVIASGLHSGDQVAPGILASVGGGGSAYILQGVRNLVGISSSSIGTDITVGTSSMTWDSATGLLTSYSLSSTVNRRMELVATNAWTPEAFDWPVFSTLAADDIYAVFFGAYFYITWSLIFLYLWVYMSARVVDRSRRLSLSSYRRYGPYTLLVIFAIAIPVALSYWAGVL